jgi:hypothetical protein
MRCASCRGSPPATPGAGSEYLVSGVVPTRAVGMVILVVTTAIGWMPLLLLLFSIGFASALGCRLDEAAVHPCRAAGMDVGPALSAGFIGGWLLLVVWPVMLITLVIWIVLLVRLLLRKHRARVAHNMKQLPILKENSVLTFTKTRGPQIIQAGTHNHNSTNVRIGLSSHPGAWPGGVSYYAHPIR